MDSLEKLVSEESETNSLRRKEEELYETNVNNKYNLLQKNKEINERLENISVGFGNKSKIEKLKKKNLNYAKNLKKTSAFINNDFKEYIPFMPGNIILCLANTGDGKSTASANIAFHTMAQPGKRVLLIANEESAQDCYNRISCLINGWHYQQHDEYTDEQWEVINKNMEVLSTRIDIIDNYDYETDEVNHATSSIEGMENIFKKVMQNFNKGIAYDVIIIDYYQNVHESILNPTANPYENQHRFGQLLDKYKNVIPAPIVLMSQRKAEKEEVEGDWKNLIEGRKSIGNVCTCAVLIKADKDNQRTEWIVKKNRWGSTLGKSIFTGYRKGRYIPYTKEFQQNVEHRKMEIENAKLLKRRMESIKEKDVE